MSSSNDPYRLRGGRIRRPASLGTDFDLTIAEQAVNFTGVPRIATTVNGSLSAPILRWRVGDTVTRRVTNLLPETSSNSIGVRPTNTKAPYSSDGRVR